MFGERLESLEARNLRQHRALESEPMGPSYWFAQIFSVGLKVLSSSMQSSESLSSFVVLCMIAR